MGIILSILGFTIITSWIIISPFVAVSCFGAIWEWVERISSKKNNK